ncbi:hypothetical protein [Kitasatospora acidiphila]|uniref:hypothetical protein n=1 Tax=Kitasatospora acidiphila TaxID=2567942 RepID=UPI003C7390D1
MIVTIALPLLVGGGAIALIWTKRVGFGAALLLFIAGFETAGTGLSGPVNQLLAAAISAISHHG